MVEKETGQGSQKAKPAPKERGPCVQVDVPIATVRKSFSVKEPLAKDLTDYAAFLSEHHGKAIDEDRVVDGLLCELARDKTFAAWRAAKGGM
jgi:hypothetical protein